MNMPDKLSSLLREKAELNRQIHLRMEIAMAVYKQWEETKDETHYTRYLVKMAMMTPLREERDALQKKIDKLQKKRRYQS